MQPELPAREVSNVAVAYDGRTVVEQLSFSIISGQRLLLCDGASA